MLSNADVKRLSELKDKEGRKEQRLFLIEGKRAVVESLTGGADIRMLIVSSGASQRKLYDVYSLAEEKGIAIEDTPAIKFTKLASTETSQGVIALAGLTELSLDEFLSKVRPKRASIVLLLDRISDPGNLGTILRSAAWFGVDGVIISAGSVDAYNPKVVRSAMGAICQVDVVQDVSLAGAISGLSEIGFGVFASTQEAGLNYADYSYPKRVAGVFGSEATGITPDVMGLCPTSVAVPRVGRMESLNVGVASAIILSEITRQRQSSK